MILQAACAETASVLIQDPILVAQSVDLALRWDVERDNVGLAGRVSICRSAVERYSVNNVPLDFFIWTFGHLRYQLKVSFEREEACGYFHDVVAAAPELSDVADALRAEHADLLAEIDRILHVAESMFLDPDGAEKYAPLLASGRTFLGRLARHEHRETSLIQRAFSQDLGVGD